MTSLPDSDSFSVWISGRRAGTIHRIGDRTRFSLDPEYREDPDRPVLGLVFEDRPDKVHVATVRVAPDGRIPRLSPAYDIVSTAHYFEGVKVEDLALKFGGHKEFHRVSLGTFRRLQERLRARDVDLAECAAVTVERTLAEWPKHAHLLDGNPRLQEAVHLSISARSKTILRTLG